MRWHVAVARLGRARHIELDQDVFRASLARVRCCAVVCVWARAEVFAPDNH